jgi:hypothetical protein
MNIFYDILESSPISFSETTLSFFTDFLVSSKGIFLKFFGNLDLTYNQMKLPNCVGVFDVMANPQSLTKVEMDECPNCKSDDIIIKKRQALMHCEVCCTSLTSTTALNLLPHHSYLHLKHPAFLPFYFAFQMTSTPSFFSPETPPACFLVRLTLSQACNYEQSVKTDDGLESVIASTTSALPLVLREAFISAQNVSFKLKEQRSREVITEFWKEYSTVRSSKTLIRNIAKMMASLSIVWEFKKHGER